MRNLLWLGASALLLLGAVGDRIDLPKAATKGTMSFEEATAKRRATRSFTSDPLTLAQVGQICWAAQGITDTSGPVKKRAIPSAMALYPLHVYLVVSTGGVKDLGAGVYRYIPDGHKLELVREGDHRDELTKAVGNQASVRMAPVSFVITADFRQMRARFADRAERFVDIEVGHAGQNIQLQAVALGLASVTVGMGDGAQMRAAVGAPEEHVPLYTLPVGKGRT
jgi:SagB-type dehydrogenase family enzyme